VPDLDRIRERNMPGINVPDQPVGPSGNPEVPFVVQPPLGFSTDAGAPLVTGIGSLTSPVNPYKAGAPPGFPEGVFQEGGYGARFLQGETRARVAMAGGGSPETEVAVGQGLEWLALHQAPNGSWSMDGFHHQAHDKYGAGSKQFTCNCTGQGVV